MATHPEALLLSAVIRTGQYQCLAAMGISSDMFLAFNEEARWLETYTVRNASAPDRATFKQKFPEFVIYKVDNPEHWCEEVREGYASAALTKAIMQALDTMDTGSIEAAVTALNMGILDVQTKTAGVSTEFDVFKDFQQTFDDVEARVRRTQEKGLAGVPTGFSTLDTITGGLQPGWLVIFGARLGVGKTWTTVKVATEAAIKGYKVAYFSLEQSKNQIAMRTHAFASAQYATNVFDSSALSKGHGFDVEAYRDFLTDLKDKVAGRFMVIDQSRGGVSPLTVANVIERDQPDIVLIDYLSKMKGGGSGEDWVALGRISGDLQDIAQRFQIPVVAGAQINRVGAGKEPPNAENLAQSDKIGQDADLLVTIAPRSTHVLHSKIAKNRHGPSGVTWYSHFDPGRGIYAEVSGDKAGQLIERDKEADDDE